MRLAHEMCAWIVTLVTAVIEFAPESAFLSNMRISRSKMGMPRFRLLLLVFLILFIAYAKNAARFLVVDEPSKSDVIVVLAGETHVRPARAVELLRQGVAPRVLLDAETRDQVYDQSLVDIARRYAAGLPEAANVSVCPILGFSTFSEADDVRRCLQPLGVHRVLIVTSEFHTRRARMIFQHRLPEYQFSVAAARNPAEFGDEWWTNREWAKTTFDEWLRFVWWEAVDRWR